MSPSQNDMGRAFEYSLAMNFSTYLPAPIVESLQTQTAQRCFASLPLNERQNMRQASKEVVAFIVAHDNRLTPKSCSISIQSDQEGMHGDVRDVIVHNANLNADIGISAKNRHWAVKHSRLSESIDFGTEWLGIRNSDNYFHQVTPIFRELNSRRRRGG